MKPPDHAEQGAQFLYCLCLRVVRVQRVNILYRRCQTQSIKHWLPLPVPLTLESKFTCHTIPSPTILQKISEMPFPNCQRQGIGFSSLGVSLCLVGLFPCPVPPLQPYDSGLEMKERHYPPGVRRGTCGPQLGPLLCGASQGSVPYITSVLPLKLKAETSLKSL